MDGAPRGAGVEGVIHCLEGGSERGKSEGGGEAEKAAKKSAVYLAISLRVMSHL